MRVGEDRQLFFQIFNGTPIYIHTITIGISIIVCPSCTKDVRKDVVLRRRLFQVHEVEFSHTIAPRCRVLLGMKPRRALQEKLLKFRPSGDVLHFLDELQQQIDRHQAAETCKKKTEELLALKVAGKEPPPEETEGEKIERENLR